MKTIKFLGAAGGVTGSSYLLTAQNGHKVLIDFGMFQGPKNLVDLNFVPLEFNPAELEGVLLTHAHLDHCGRLPLLIRGGFNKKIYMTAPTRSLVEVILNDSARVAQENPEREVLYGQDDVDKVLAMIQVVEYNEEFALGSFKVVFRDAGHILGSASIELTDTADNKTIVFSGDLGNTPEDIIKPTQFIERADIVVMESTYGDKVHPKEDPTQVLCEEINKIERNGGVLLIPAFSLERTQELLHRINHLKRDKKIKGDLPIFMDSPMGIRATVIFRDFKQYYNEELQSHTDDPFSFEGLVVTENVRDSRDILRVIDPKVIIAGSGMLTGGRILHHAFNYLSRANTRILFVGYQAEETLGREILEGAKKVVIYKRKIKVRASIREIESLSSHADQPKLLDWLWYIKDVKKVFLTHGEKTEREILAQKIKSDLHLQDIVLPEMGDEVSLESSM